MTYLKEINDLILKLVALKASLIQQDDNNLEVNEKDKIIDKLVKKIQELYVVEYKNDKHGQLILRAITHAMKTQGPDIIEATLRVIVSIELNRVVDFNSEEVGKIIKKCDEFLKHHQLRFKDFARFELAERILRQTDGSPDDLKKLFTMHDGAVLTAAACENLKSNIEPNIEPFKRLIELKDRLIKKTQFKSVDEFREAIATEIKRDAKIATRTKNNVLQQAFVPPTMVDCTKEALVEAKQIIVDAFNGSSDNLETFETNLKQELVENKISLQEAQIKAINEEIKAINKEIKGIGNCTDKTKIEQEKIIKTIDAKYLDIHALEGRLGAQEKLKRDQVFDQEANQLMGNIDIKTLFHDLTRLLENKKQEEGVSQKSNSILLIAKDINPREWTDALKDAFIYIIQLIILPIAILRAFGVGDYYFVTDSASQQRVENAAESFSKMLKEQNLLGNVPRALIK